MTENEPKMKSKKTKAKGNPGRVAARLAPFCFSLFVFHFSFTAVSAQSNHDAAEVAATGEVGATEVAAAGFDTPTRPNHATEEVAVAGFDTLARNPEAYRRILDKFVAGVVRPSVSECTVAYYGFAMREAYSGAVEGEQNLIEAVMAGRFLPAYLVGKQILESHPVSLTALYYTLHAATQIREPWEVRNSLRAKYNSISFVISQSGDGTSPQTALRTIYLGDIYTYASVELGLEIGRGYLLDDRWMALEVTPSAKFAHEIIYFDTLVDTGGNAEGGENIM
jgi:hypothetical protein